MPALHCRWLGACLATLALACGAATPLPGPLERPALAVRDGEHAAMMGLARAGQRLVAVGEHGSVLLSDDDGAHWRQAAAVPVSVSLTAVQFVDDKTGWATGHYGVVLRSDDGGEHWVRQLDGRQIGQLRLAEAQAGGRAADLADARRAVQEGPDKPLLALHFSNAREGLVSGAFGLLLATHDGGKSWQSISGRLDNAKGAHLYALHRQGELVLLAGEQGLLLHSADGGAHFRRVDTPYQGSWFCVTREADGAWLLAGLRGNVQRSRDEGKTWTALASPVPVSFTALMTSDNDTWLANQGGQVMRVARGADTLASAAQSPAQQPAALARTRDGALLLAGWTGLTRVPLAAR